MTQYLIRCHQSLQEARKGHQRALDMGTEAVEVANRVADQNQLLLTVVKALVDVNLPPQLRDELRDALAKMKDAEGQTQDGEPGQRNPRKHA